MQVSVVSALGADIFIATMIRKYFLTYEELGGCNTSSYFFFFNDLYIMM